MIPQKVIDNLIQEGFGTNTDPMVVEIDFPDHDEFVQWVRDNRVLGRWAGIIQDAFLYYVPDTTQYIFTKMRWS